MKACYTWSMADSTHSPLTRPEDGESAQRFFEEFFTKYQPVFTRAEVYLGNLIKEAPDFAEAYRPWQNALRDLSRGVYFINRKIPMTNAKGFLEALKMFSLESVIHFLRDICLSCHMQLERDWAEKFREHMDMLFFSYLLLQRNKQPEMAR